MEASRSERLFAEACRVLVGGVNSPVRAFRRVGGTPRFLRAGKGSRVWDEDGNEYIDYVGSWGPLILGHAHPRVVEAVTTAAVDGLTFGAPTEREIRLAERVQQRMPSIERLRLVCSGTEATMSALRLARAFTRRDGFIKFEGAYHGHADPFLSQAGSGLATLGVPDSAGIPAETARHARTVPFNDFHAVEAILRKHAEHLGAIIVEPVAGNMGVVVPEPGFLQGLRELADDHGLLLIFDEIITGFRVASGGAQERYHVRPDLTCLGKVLGGGLPLAAYGGREDVMRLVAPEGPVYQAGTLAGNPLAVAAGCATLDALTPNVYEELETRSSRLAEGLLRATERNAVVNRVGSLLSLFFARRPPRNYQDVLACNADQYVHLFHELLARGVYFAPSPYEALFVSAAHTTNDLDLTIRAVAERYVDGPRAPIAPRASA